MSLSSFNDLKEEVASFLNRTDLTVSIPTFIRLAESELNRVLDCRQMVEITTLTISGESIFLPDGFAGVKSIRFVASPVTKLEYVRPAAFDDACDAAGQTGRPIYYTIAGEKLVFSPMAQTGGQVRLRYRRRLDPLSASYASNWLLEQHPDAYLYGALKQSALFLMDDERLPRWSGLFGDLVANINDDDQRQSYGASMQTRSGISDG